MFLHKIHLDLRRREVRRDVADPYQMHSTLCRAFSSPEKPCPNGEFLWRLEPETDQKGNPRVLIQSRSPAAWSDSGLQDWLANEPDVALDLRKRLGLAILSAGVVFRFRLRANPSTTRNGRRHGIRDAEGQTTWLARKGESHGFGLKSVQISQESMLVGRRHDGNAIRVFSVLFDGVLRVQDPERFRETLHNGIGHGKVMGLGLLSVARV